jgi:hypothetical protein
MKRLLLLPLAVALVLVFGAPVLATPSGLLTLAPSATAWFDHGYPTATSPPPPPPPGVTADDLYVAGVTVPANALPVAVPLGGVRSTLALSALRFVIPAGMTPASLTLVLSSGPSTASAGNRVPTGVTLEACPTTSSFQPGGHQPFDQVPTYDCTGRTSLSSVSTDGTSVVFSDIARVARGRVLSFVIRPGTTGADRLVFAKPTSKALSLLSFDAPPVFTPTGQLPPPTSAPAVGALTPGAAAKAPMAGPWAPRTPAPSPQSLPTPALAGTEAQLGGLAATPATDESLVRWAALGGLALLLSSGAWLAFTDKRPDPTGQEWGFGRYRAPRHGRAPSL